MIYFHRELKEKLGSDYQIKKALERKEYFKIEKGLYSDTEYVNQLTIIVKKYPYAVISGESAYYYYDLTDFIPNKIVLTTTKNSTIRSDLVKQVRVNDNLFNFGIEETIINGVKVNMYNKERMLVELVRNKNHMGYDLYKEVINNYRKNAYNLDMEKIEEYLKYYRNSNKLFDMIQSEVF